MTRDYKNTPKPGAAPKKKKKAPAATPGWVWLLAGLAIGLFVALLVYLKDFSVLPNKAAPVVDRGQPAEPVEKKVVPEKAPEAHAPLQKPRFDFYNLLPEMEVLIPDQELATEREKEPAEKVVYYLQAASFRKFEEADRMRAQLALMNIESQIQRVTVNDTSTWHRVRIGPFTSARKMDKVRSRLRAANIDPIVLKLKPKN